MNKYILLLLCWIISISSQAQTERYKKAIFPNTTKLSNIQYGMADKYDALGINNPEPLLLDLYQPTGDTICQRPLVLVFFGGAFLVGDKNMEDMVAWADSLASYGYSCAAVNYRIGFNPASIRSSIRAGYRALQDARAAIRFFKHYASTYNINPNQIYLAGNSAGAITAIQAAYGADINRPSDTYASSGFSLDERPDLGCMDCSGNSFTNSPTVAGVIGLWGAGFDKSALDSSDTAPALMIHGENDSVVPVDSGQAFSSPTFPILYGSRTIHKVRQSQGLHSELHVYSGLDHNFYYDGISFPNAYWDSIWTLSHPFLCQINPGCINNTSIYKIHNEVFYELYPSPSRKIMDIVFDDKVLGQEKKIQILNLQGQIVYQTKTSDKILHIDATAQAAGIYLLHIQTPNRRHSKKMLFR